MIIYDIVNHFFMTGNMEEINFYGGKGFFGAEKLLNLNII
jgi:hypothetical protein